MLLYNTIFVLIVILLIINQFVKQKKFIELFIIIALSIFSGLRYGIGTDYEFYTWYFIEYPKNIGHVEPFFYLIGAFIKLLGFGSPVYYGVLTFIILLIVRASIKRFQVNYALSLIIYLGYFFLTHNFNTIRHGFMVAIVWYAMSFLYQGKNKKYYILIIVASMFHIGGIVMLLFPLLKYKHLRTPYIIGITIASLLLSYFIYFPGIIEYLAPAEDTVIGYRIHKYFTTYYEGKSKEEMAYGISIGTVLNILILGLALLIRGKNKFDKEFNLLINSLFSGLIILLLFNSVGIFVERLSNLFYFSLVFLLPYLITKIKNESNKIITYTLIILLSFAYWNKILLSKESKGNYQYVPYETIF